MSDNMQYSPTQVADIIEWRDVEGLTWTDLTRKFNDKYGETKTINAVRHVYKSYSYLYDSECSDNIIEQLKKNLVGRKANYKAIKQNKVILEYLNFEDELKEKVKPLITKLNKFKGVPMRKKSSKKRNMTIEVLLSDLHIGMIHNEYNHKDAVARMKEFTRTLLDEIERESAKYNIDRIILALMGDVIHSATMHGRESTRACEFGNSEQVVRAIDVLYKEVILPLAELGIDIYVPCVTGNHDRAEEKGSFVNPGEHNLSWVVYTMLEMLCEQAEIPNVKFDISREIYSHTSIYGNTVMYEHGNILKSLNKLSVDKLLQRRQQQIGSIIDFYRFGHFHEYTMFGRGKIICNGSLGGKDGFSSALGFMSCATQTINFYVKTKKRPTCFFKSFPVYLGE